LRLFFAQSTILCRIMRWSTSLLCIWNDTARKKQWPSPVIACAIFKFKIGPIALFRPGTKYRLPRQISTYIKSMLSSSTVIWKRNSYQLFLKNTALMLALQIIKSINLWTAITETSDSCLGLDFVVNAGFFQCHQLNLTWMFQFEKNLPHSSHRRHVLCCLFRVFL